MNLQGTFHIKDADDNDYALIPESATSEKEGVVLLADPNTTGQTGAIAATPTSVSQQIVNEVFTERSDNNKIPWANIGTGNSSPVLKGTIPEQHGDVLTLNGDNLEYSSDMNKGSDTQPVYIANGHFQPSQPIVNVQQSATNNTVDRQQPILLRAGEATGPIEPTEYYTGLAYNPGTKELITPKLYVAEGSNLYETSFEKNGEPYSPEYYPGVYPSGDSRIGRPITNSIGDYVIEEFVPVYEFLPGNKEEEGQYTLLGDYRHIPSNYTPSSEHAVLRYGPYEHWAYRIWRNGRLEVWRYSWLTTEYSPSGPDSWNNQSGWFKNGIYYETIDNSYRNIYNRNEFNTQTGNKGFCNIQLPPGIEFSREPSWQINLRYVLNVNKNKVTFNPFDDQNDKFALSQIAGFKWIMPQVSGSNPYLLPPLLRAYTFAHAESDDRDALTKSLHTIYYEAYASGFYNINTSSQLES